MKRVLTALVLVPVLIAIIGYAPPLGFYSWSVEHPSWHSKSISRWPLKRGSKFFASQVTAVRLLLLSSFYGSATNATNSWTALLVLVASCCCSSPWVCAAVTVFQLSCRALQEPC